MPCTASLLPNESSNVAWGRTAPARRMIPRWRWSRERPRRQGRRGRTCETCTPLSRKALRCCTTSTVVSALRLPEATVVAVVGTAVTYLAPWAPLLSRQPAHHSHTTPSRSPASIACSPFPMLRCHPRSQLRPRRVGHALPTLRGCLVQPPRLRRILQGLAMGLGRLATWRRSMARCLRLWASGGHLDSLLA